MKLKSGRPLPKNAATKNRRISRAKRIFNENYMLYLMLMPTMAYFIIFHVVPIINMKLAFYDYRIMGDDIFVGWKWFEKLFSTPMFWRILQNTLIISFMKIILYFPFPILFALILNELRRSSFRKSIQVISYLPHFLSWVVIAGVWFSFMGRTGAVNSLLALANIEPIDFLTNKANIRWTLFFSEAWRSIGWDSIIFSAGILGIDNVLYEAAAIDGANRAQIVGKIILPALVPTMITVLILNIGFLLNAGLEQVLNFSNDAVISKVDIIDTYVYRIGLQNSQYSFATAAYLFKGIVGAILVVTTHLISKKLTGKGAW